MLYMGHIRQNLKKRRALITDTTELAFDRLMKGMDVQGSKLIPATGSNSSNQTNAASLRNARQVGILSV